MVNVFKTLCAKFYQNRSRFYKRHDKNILAYFLLGHRKFTLWNCGDIIMVSWKIFTFSVANLFRILCTKFYQNRRTLVEDMTKTFGLIFVRDTVYKLWLACTLLWWWYTVRNLLYLNADKICKALTIAVFDAVSKINETRRSLTANCQLVWQPESCIFEQVIFEHNWSRRDLDLSPFDLKILSVHLCLNSNLNRKFGKIWWIRYRVHELLVHDHARTDACNARTFRKQNAFGWLTPAKA